MSTHNIGFYEEKKKEYKDQKLKQSESKSSPQNQNITNSQNTKRHMVTGLSSYFPKGGHSAAQTEQKIITQARRNITETRHQKQATEKHNKTTALEWSVM